MYPSTKYSVLLITPLDGLISISLKELPKKIVGGETAASFHYILPLPSEILYVMISVGEVDTAFTTPITPIRAASVSNL